MRPIRLQLAEMQPAQIATTPPAADRGRIKPGLGAGFAAAALIGIIIWCQPATAAVCRIPATVLCEGCVERLSIRVAPGGACRISFTSATPAEQTGAAAKFVDINVETEPQRPTLRRASAGHAVPLRASAGCFFFNGRRFCE
jgi:hypothetical protein